MAVHRNHACGWNQAIDAVTNMVAVESKIGALFTISVSSLFWPGFAYDCISLTYTMRILAVAVLTFLIAVSSIGEYADPLSQFYPGDIIKTRSLPIFYLTLLLAFPFQLAPISQRRAELLCLLATEQLLPVVKEEFLLVRREDFDAPKNHTPLNKNGENSLPTCLSGVARGCYIFPVASRRSFGSKRCCLDLCALAIAVRCKIPSMR